MRQAIYGLILYIFLMVPAVITLTESIMSIHMHMQMPLLGVVGLLFYPLFQKIFPNFFTKWNKNGLPGMLLFFIIIIYWLLPRAMDEALTSQTIEVFKFISWPFLAGLPLRDSWPKLTSRVKNITILIISILYIGMGLLYMLVDEQLCNNYLIVEQKALGWGFFIIALALILYLVQNKLIDHSQYE